MKTSPIFKFTFCILLLTASFTSFAQQKKTLTDEEQVQEAVSQEIETVFKSKDFLKIKDKKFADVTGYIVTDISVVKNGKIATFFKVDSDIKNNDFFEFLSDYLLDYKFNFKLPKQQKYKIRQTIQL